MKKEVALIIIYNHRYDKNIEILERLYSQRFSNIFHLMPFYDGDRENVISVYENSYYFQGYISQGLDKYFDEKYSHYFFIADDLMINPLINENNYIEYFNLDKKTSFISGFITLHERKKFWPRVREAYEYKPDKRGLEIINELPSYGEAIERFDKFNLKIQPLSVNQIYRNVTHSISKESIYELSYPLVGSYSDIVVISADYIKQFCHYCGVFAASDLFVELAIPTALVLAVEKIVTEKDLCLQGKALWTSDDYEELTQYNKNLTLLLSDFPKNYLYLHPVKLSEWDVLT